jgi:hypothetical protein
MSRETISREIMSYPTEPARMFLPIPAADRQQALEFAAGQVTATARQQAYANRLALLVTQRYLDLLEIESAPQPQNPTTQLSASLSTLYIPEAKGQLECRAVAASAQKCHIPEEAWANRLGLVVVQLNETATLGTLLGFAPELRVSELPLSYLQPLEALLDQITPPVWNLSQWMTGQLGRGWELLQQVTDPVSPPAWSYRSTRFRHQTEQELAQIIQTPRSEEERWDAAERLHQLNPQHPDSGLWAIDLALQIADQSLSLMVAILTVPQGKAILLRLHPAAGSHLPQGLSLTGRSEGATLFELLARPESRGLQYYFLADPGDQFQIEIGLGAARLTEHFVV